MRVLLIVFFAALTSGASAQCPKNPEISQELEQAYRTLKFAKFPRDAQAATDVLWRLWTRAPDDRAQLMLNRGMMNLRLGDLAAAEGLLTALIEYCPNYAEGYNQRAFALYLAGNFQGALPDLVHTLSIQPRHLGALSGKGLTHLALGQSELAAIEFRKELALNPFAADRDLILNLGTDL